MPYADAQTVKKSEWDKRIARAADLAERFVYAREVLAFYAKVLELQKKVFDDIPAESRNPDSTDAPLRMQLRVADASRYLPRLLALVEEHGPARLAEEAQVTRKKSLEQQREMLQGLIAGEAIPQPFFARALVQPYAERFAMNFSPVTLTTVRVCPVCNSRPQAAVLRPEGDGGKRFLLCSFCLTEWEFRRILCPFCGEEDYKKLPRYSAEEHDSVRVEACDTCHFYLKSIDMTVDGLAVPLVDEVASVPLDLWAAEHGYKKAEPNLMGF
jgi:FdhE protein